MWFEVTVICIDIDPHANSSASPSGWNWVAYTFSPTRNICTGQLLPVMSNVAPSGVMIHRSFYYAGKY